MSMLDNVQKYTILRNTKVYTTIRFEQSSASGTIYAGATVVAQTGTGDTSGVAHILSINGDYDGVVVGSYIPRNNLSAIDEGNEATTVGIDTGKYYKVKGDCKTYIDSDFVSAVGVLKEGCRVNISESTSKYIKIKKVLNNLGSGICDNTYISTNDAYNNLEAINYSPEAYTSKNNIASNISELVGSAQQTVSATSTTQIYIDDSTPDSIELNSFMTNEEYNQNLEDGLNIKSIGSILGVPYQFLPYTDPRIDGTKNEDSLGRTYAEKIVSPIPLLLMTPGTPEFMASYKKKEKSMVLNAIEGIIDKSDISNLLTEKSGKYYSLKYDYTDYFHYVNAMLRSAAYFLGIQDKKINNCKLKTFDWYKFKNDKDGEDEFGNSGLRKYLGTYAGAIPFYIDSDTSINDDFSNSTTSSALSSTIQGLSDKARELNYLLGMVGGGLDIGTDENSTIDLSGVSSKIGGMFSSEKNIFSSILNNASTIARGGRMIFPEMWEESSFSRSYNVKMKLVSPSGDKFSVFLNILVPIYFLLAFTLPRQGASQSYFSPFLVRAFYKGLFNVDMGIITDLSVSKGSEGEWTDYGVPTVADVSFTIKDLYSQLAMSEASMDSDMSIMTNISELDYIANSCGININEPELKRTIEMYINLDFIGNIKDKIELNIFGSVAQHFNNKLNKVFGMFK